VCRLGSDNMGLEVKCLLLLCYDINGKSERLANWSKSICLVMKSPNININQIVVP